MDALSTRLRVLALVGAVLCGGFLGALSMRAIIYRRLEVAPETPEVSAAKAWISAPPAFTTDDEDRPTLDFSGPPTRRDYPHARLHHVRDMGLDPKPFAEALRPARGTFYNLLCYPERFSTQVSEDLRFHYAGGLTSRAGFLRSYTIRDVRTREAVLQRDFPPRTKAIRREPVANFYRGGAQFSWSLSIKAEDVPNPGLYALELVDDAGDTAPPIYFNRRPKPDRAPKILLVLPELTWQAYNPEGGGNLYGIWVPGLGSRFAANSLFQVSLLRPVPPYFEPFHRPALSIHFIDVLQEAGLDFGCVSDLDLEDPRALEGVQTLVFGGHCEYWTPAMRTNVDAFLRSGGDIANFSGNICWYYVGLDEPRQEMWVSKAEPKDRPHAVAKFNATGTTDRFDSAERTFGVTWRCGGYPLKRKLPTAEKAKEVGLSPEDWAASSGVRVERPEHPIFAGTGLSKGDVWGQDSGLIAVEIDAAPLSKTAPTELARPPEGKTSLFPPDLEILGTTHVFTANPSDFNGYGEVLRAGVLVECVPFEGGGTVLSLASIGFGLSLEKDETTRKVFKNTLSYLSSR